MAISVCMCGASSDRWLPISSIWCHSPRQQVALHSSRFKAIGAEYVAGTLFRRKATGVCIAVLGASVRAGRRLGVCHQGFQVMRWGRNISMPMRWTNK
jgi:hypothetical protein